jgi:hypothetical protein
MTDYELEIRAIFGCAMGSPVIQCKCGRYVFGGNGTDMEDGELEELENKAKVNPAGYCCHPNCDGVVAVDFNGAPHVFGCDCEWEKRLGTFLDQNERAFVEYYKRKIERVQRQLRESAATLTAFAGAASNSIVGQRDAAQPLLGGDDGGGR